MKETERIDPTKRAGTIIQIIELVLCPKSDTLGNKPESSATCLPEKPTISSVTRNIDSQFTVFCISLSHKAPKECYGIRSNSQQQETKKIKAVQYICQVILKDSVIQPSRSGGNGIIQKGSNFAVT